MPGSTLVPRSVTVFPVLAPALLEVIARARRDAWSDGLRLPSEVDDFEKQLRALIGEVVNASPAPDVRWIPTVEAARRFGLSVRRVRAMTDRRVDPLPKRLVSGRLYVDEDAVAAEVEARASRGFPETVEVA